MREDGETGAPPYAGPSSEGACPICHERVFIGADEYCEHYLCSIGDEGPLARSRRVDAFMPAVEGLVNRFYLDDDYPDNADEVRDWLLEQAPPDLSEVVAQAAAVANGVDSPHYWRDDASVQTVTWEVTGSEFGSAGRDYYHPEAATFAHSVKAKAEAASAWLVTQLGSLPESGPDGDIAETE